MISLGLSTLLGITYPEVARDDTGRQIWYYKGCRIEAILRKIQES
jgi:hypothetical protein